MKQIVATCCALLVVTAVYLVRPIIEARNAARQSSCTGHLSQLRHAVLQYYSLHRSYPPRVLVNNDGSRVTCFNLLRSLAETDEYFHCVIRNSAGSARRHWLVAGPETIWTSTVPMRSKDVSDGIKNTLLFLEEGTEDRLVNSPVEIEIADLPFLEDDVGMIQPATGHGNDRGMIFADLMYCRQVKPLMTATLQALMTANGAEKVSRDDLIREGALVSLSQARLPIAD